MAKRHMTAYEKMCQKIEEEGRKQCFLLYSATGIALWRHYGKRTKTITDLFLLSREIWQECASDHDHRMDPKRIRKACFEETGIDVAVIVTTGEKQ